MFKSLKSLGESSRYVPVIKRKLTNQKDICVDRVFAIESIEQFREKLRDSDSPVLVNFSATWCLNCTILSPLIESIVCDHPRKFKLLKVDIEKHIDLAMEYNVSVIPVIFGVSRGQILSSLIGLQKIEKIQSWLDDFLKKA